jgi:hypothetical protein
VGALSPIARHVGATNDAWDVAEWPRLGGVETMGSSLADAHANVVACSAAARQVAVRGPPYTIIGYVGVTPHTQRLDNMLRSRLHLRLNQEFTYPGLLESVISPVGVIVSQNTPLKAVTNHACT